MTSARKIESNRANAKKSTGPKSALGKVRAAKNARRHGLSVSVAVDPFLAEQIKSLAQEIAIGMGAFELAELASSVAETEVDLLRIRQMSRRLLGNRSSDRDGVRHSAVSNNSQQKSGFDNLSAIADRLTNGSPKFVERGADIIKELLLMDRYERRARSRRKFAIRAFELARQQIMKS